MNCPTFFYAQLGNDLCSKPILKDLTDRNVNVDHVHLLDNISTGQAFVTVQKDGANSIVIVGGANTHWNEQALKPELNKLLDEANCVILQREIPDSVNILVANMAHAKS